MLVWSSYVMASLFSVHFDVKQCRDGFEQPHFCDLSPVLFSVTLWSSFVCSLLLDMGPYDKKASHGMCPSFHKQLAQELAPELAVIFRLMWEGE